MGFFSGLGKLITGAGGLMSAIPGVGPIVGGAVSTIGGIMDSEASKSEARDQLKMEQKFNAEQAQLNRDFQKSERLATQEFNLDMWNKTNEYNSLSSQLERAREAGVNPNMVIGDGNNAQAFTSSPMSGSMASSPGSIASGILTQDLEVQRLIGQNRLINAQATKQEIDNQTAPVLNDAMIKKAQAEASKSFADRGFTEEQTRQAKELFPLLKGKTEQELSNLEQELEVMFAQIEQMRKQNEVSDSQIALNEANALKSNEEGKFKQWENDFREKFGVAPGSGLIDGIIQLSVSGEKGSEIAYSLVKTVLHMVKGIVTSPIRGFNDAFVEKTGQTLQVLPSYGYTQEPNKSIYR